MRAVQRVPCRNSDRQHKVVTTGTGAERSVEDKNRSLARDEHLTVSDP